MEIAKSARSVCRLCEKPIADKELRAGPVEKLDDKDIFVPACLCPCSDTFLSCCPCAPHGAERCLASKLTGINGNRVQGITFNAPQPQEATSASPPN